MVTINWFIAGACEELSSHIGYAIAPAYKPLIKTILYRSLISLLKEMSNRGCYEQLFKI